VVQSLKILFLAAEVAPLAKVGGLADVAGELSQALVQLGINLRVCLPLHTTIDRKGLGLEKILSVEVTHKRGVETATVYESGNRDVTIWLIDGQPVQQAPGVYSDMGVDAQKFTFANLAALLVCERLNWIPDILHAHDWHTAAAVMQLKQLRHEDQRWRKAGSLYTIHNLPYMGAGAEIALMEYGVPLEESEHLPVWARELPLPQGLLQADWVSTVSPTYAREIQTPEFGHGLDRLLKTRNASLSGILNGIDPVVWDPDQDQAISQPFNIETLGARVANKSSLQSALGLPLEPRTPLIGMVTRLDTQKGMDLVWPALDSLSTGTWQFIILGTGDPKLEEASRMCAERHPDQVRISLCFDPDLARQIYAGSDMLLIPSRYEPCGLTQMIAMRYGSVPLVRATGGLLDTVTDVKTSSAGTGFIFQEASSAALKATLERAFEHYKDPDRWEALQRNGMRQDFSWTQSAKEYINLYQHVSGLGYVA
jgi:starch synthase